MWGDELREEIDVVDLAYAAGIIDGEGSIYITRSIRRFMTEAGLRERPAYVLRITVVHTDRPLVDWLAETFGGGARTLPVRDKKWKPQFVWVAGGGRAAQITGVLLPYMRVKVDQAELALEFQSRIGTRKPRPRLTEEEQSIRADYKRRLMEMKH